MAQQEGGWPLGLQPLNRRVGVIRNRTFSRSISFSTLLTATTTSATSSATDSSSDLDTESTGSFFHDKSNTTLGSLIGIPNILELSRRSIKARRRSESFKEKKTHKSKIWFFSLCNSNADADTESVINAPPLAHFLQVERKAMRDQNQMIFDDERYEFSEAHYGSESNPLFVDGRVAPPIGPSLGSIINKRSNGGSDDGTGYNGPMFFSCICGQPRD